MQTVRVFLGSRSYPIHIGSGIISDLRSYLADLKNVTKILLVTDGNVDSFHSKTIERAVQKIEQPVIRFTVPSGEASKSIKMTSFLWEGFLNAGADRNSVVLVIGGGMVGDLGGFAAATYMRGIRLFQIPTTLLAQVDSSVGGKTAIDLDAGKNSVGAFHQPSGVLIDTDLLKTLPEREFRSGLGEVVKYGIGLDQDFFTYLEENADKINAHDSDVLTEIISRCCAIKADVVKADERETSGVRALLNLGHTFAHAYETADGFTNILHGEAVAIGLLDALCLAQMAAAAGIAGFSGMTKDAAERIYDLCGRLALPTFLPPSLLRRSPLWSAASLLESMRKDKKSSSGQIRFVLPTRIGASALFSDIPEQLVLDTLNQRLSD